MFLEETEEFLFVQILCHSVCDVLIGRNVDQDDLFILDLFSDPMITKGDVFRSWFDHLMFGHLDCRLIIDEDLDTGLIELEFVDESF